MGIYRYVSLHHSTYDSRLYITGPRRSGYPAAFAASVQTALQHLLALYLAASSMPQSNSLVPGLHCLVFPSHGKQYLLIAGNPSGKMQTIWRYCRHKGQHHPLYVMLIECKSGMPCTATGECISNSVESLRLQLPLPMQAPWAMAFTEAVVMPVVYVIVVQDWKIPNFLHLHYSWWKSEEDIVLFSWLRALTAFVSFFFGFGTNLHM